MKQAGSAPVQSPLLESNPTLAEILRTRKTIDETGAPIELHSEIPRHFAEALYRTVASLRPLLAIEIGMAYGISTLAMLTALKDCSESTLVSIDPMQSTHWRGAGLHAVRRAGLAERHRLIEQPDYLALPNLLASGAQVDFAYIDGTHVFDYVLLDFFYIDRMLRPGGVIAFNDCSFPAIHKVLRFIISHRRYTEIDVGLAATPAWESRRTRLLRSIGLSGLSRTQRDLRPVAEDRYFKKLETWEPDWNFFEEF